VYSEKLMMHMCNEAQQTSTKKEKKRREERKEMNE
jgi:hypothetical protein